MDHINELAQAHTAALNAHARAFLAGATTKQKLESVEEAIRHLGVAMDLLRDQVDAEDRALNLTLAANDYVATIGA